MYQGTCNLGAWCPFTFFYFIKVLRKKDLLLPKTANRKVQVRRKFGGERIVIICVNIAKDMLSFSAYSFIFSIFTKYLSRYLVENEHVWIQRNLYLDFPFFIDTEIEVPRNNYIFIRKSR